MDYYTCKHQYGPTIKNVHSSVGTGCLLEDLLRVIGTDGERERERERERESRKIPYC